MKTRFLLLGIAFAITTVSRAQQPGVRPPKLVVLLMVDQMRADYVDRFKSDWNGGLKRLVSHGVWFRHAAYPYLTTVTCAGHATVSIAHSPSMPSRLTLPLVPGISVPTGLPPCPGLRGEPCRTYVP